MSTPEVWLRGPVENVPPLLQPVAHALLQCREEIEAHVSPLTAEELWRAPHRGPWMALGAALAIVGVIAAFWPRLTLGALALLTGLSLIVHGACRIGLAIVARREIPHWGWLAVAGVVSVVIGLLVLAWPEATVLVLSLFLGAQLALFGVVLTIGAFLPAGDRTGLPSAS